MYGHLLRQSAARLRGGQPQQGPVVKMRRLGLLLALSCIEAAHAANVYDNCTSVAPGTVAGTMIVTYVYN